MAPWRWWLGATGQTWAAVSALANTAVSIVSKVCFDLQPKVEMKEGWGGSVTFFLGQHLFSYLSPHGPQVTCSPGSLGSGTQWAASLRSLHPCSPSFIFQVLQFIKGTEKCSYMGDIWQCPWTLGLVYSLENPDTALSENLEAWLTTKEITIQQLCQVGYPEQGCT